MKAVIEVCKYRFKILTLTINSYADPWVSLLQLLSLTSSFAVSDLLPLSLSPLTGLPTGLNPLSCQTSVIPFCSFSHSLLLSTCCLQLQVMDHLLYLNQSGASPVINLVRNRWFSMTVISEWLAQNRGYSNSTNWWLLFLMTYWW